MFYIVRYWLAGTLYEENFDDLPTARAFMRECGCDAELYVWFGGEEKYMEGVQANE